MKIRSAVVESLHADRVTSQADVCDLQHDAVTHTPTSCPHKQFHSQTNSGSWTRQYDTPLGSITAPEWPQTWVTSIHPSSFLRSNTSHTRSSSPKLCFHFLYHYLKNTVTEHRGRLSSDYVASLTFASCGTWGWGDLDRFARDDRGWRWRWPKGRAHSQNTHTEMCTFIFSLVWSACITETRGDFWKRCKSLSLPPTPRLEAK